MLPMPKPLLLPQHDVLWLDKVQGLKQRHLGQIEGAFGEINSTKMNSSHLGKGLLAQII